jgi:glycosyltransferase involved in cell wall biosynthesis
MKVSIVIPTYNRASTLQRAIDSCIAQDYPDIEIIVVDDGSTDDTEEIIRTKYKSQVIYYKQENAGVCTARNIGKSLASGEIISFLDSDDEFKLNKISQIVDLFKRHPDIAFILNETTKVLNNKKEYKGSSNSKAFILQPIDIVMEKVSLSASLITIRSELEISFNPEFPSSNDLDFILRTLNSTKGMYYHRPLTRIHKTLSIDRISTNYLAKIIGWENILKSISSYKLSNSLQETYISKTYWNLFIFSLMQKDIERVFKYKKLLTKQTLSPFKKLIIIISPILTLPIIHSSMIKLIKLLWNKNLIK